MVRRGIIPARAGFTSRWLGLSGQDGDHPRSRGVYRSTGRVRACSSGSSPLARGLHGGLAGRGRRRRIIPARAGFTLRAGRRHRHARDHPRSRGVYGYPADGDWRGRGSSPLARGLRVPVVVVSQGDGIIPARAGFTWSLWFRSFRTPGSSPLARGLRARGGRRLLAGGIIPARAGFTCDADRGHVPGRDHPRSRGVYYRSSPVTGPAPGSSPLARGLPTPR